MIKEILKNEDYPFDGKIDLFGHVSEQTIQDLVDTVRVHENGIGLSAPQIGVLEPAFVIDIGNQVVVVTNPKILKRSGKRITIEEGCLSFPGRHVKMKRRDKILVEFSIMDSLDKERPTENLKGMSARVFQHEYDHLVGVCIVGKNYQDNIGVEI